MTKKITKAACEYKLRAARDVVDVIQGKWRIPIIVSLTFGNKRYLDTGFV